MPLLAVLVLVAVLFNSFSGVGDVANRQGSVGVGVLGLSHVLGLRHEGAAGASRPDHPQRRAHHLVPGILRSYILYNHASAFRPKPHP